VGFELLPTKSEQADRSFAYDMELPEAILKHPSMVTIANATCDLVAFGNDVISFPREAKALELENLVTLYMHENQCVGDCLLCD
jgi:hypothetical protein